MLVKINKKPIDVMDEDKEEKDFDPVYLCVSTIGYVLALFIMDMVCYTFFYVHPFPFLSWLFKMIGAVMAWI